MKAPSFAVWMAAAVLGASAVAFWDERRESDAALAELGEEPSAIAASIATLATRAPADPISTDELHELAAIETPGARRVLLRRAGESDLVAADGTRYASEPIAHALAAHESVLRLARPDAAAIGLPARSAFAGLRSFEWHGRAYDVIVVTSAARERDREVRAQWRLVLSILLVAGLVLGFGAAAMRRQRKELELSRELAVAAVARERDERLGREARLATLAALATGIAHDVSTPLGVIVARADGIASSETADPKAKRAATIVLEQAERIHATIRGFLGLARGATPPLVHAAAHELAERAVELTEHRFSEAGVSVTIDAAADVPRVSCDPLLFEHVLVNLLLNACDAAAPGGNVEVRVARAAERRVSFSVVDDGPGISDEAAKHAVEPFFTTKPVGKGTGLGLAIANEIVAHHNGTLAIAKRDDARGTIATVTLREAETADA
ncbi:MAG TPA: HAMP domain-containing sensor histidine kinase [Labilithrix sp.]